MLSPQPPMMEQEEVPMIRFRLLLICVLAIVLLLACSAAADAKSKWPRQPAPTTTASWTLYR